jgi:hypothetical protein
LTVCEISSFGWPTNGGSLARRMTSINIHLLLLFSSLFTLSFSNFPPFSCQLNSTQSEHPDHRIIFYHTRKCGGWTIHNYFTKILKAQFGNTCQLNKGQIVDKTDWRCEMGYVQGGTSPSQQCLALNKFYESRWYFFFFSFPQSHDSYQFSQVEHPLLRQHIFPSFVTTMTVLRHPIERVISSYRMIRNTFLNEPDWNMKDWLLHSHMLPLNQTPPSQPNANDTRRLWNSKKISGSTKKPFPRKPVNGDSSPKPPTAHPGAAPSPLPSPAPTRIKMSFPRLPSVRTLPTDGLDENYMTKWLCGRWTQLSPATEECFQRALANLHQFDFVFLTESLSSDLPLSVKLLGINITQSHEQVSSLCLSISLNASPFFPRWLHTTFVCMILNWRALTISTTPPISLTYLRFQSSLKMTGLMRSLWRWISTISNCIVTLSFATVSLWRRTAQFKIANNSQHQCFWKQGAHNNGR